MYCLWMFHLRMIKIFDKLGILIEELQSYNSPPGTNVETPLAVCELRSKHVFVVGQHEWAFNEF